MHRCETKLALERTRWSRTPCRVSSKDASVLYREADNPYYLRVCGRIAARAANSTLLGYVSQANSSVGNFGVTQNVSEALEVVFTIVKGAKSITSTSFELKVVLF